MSSATKLSALSKFKSNPSVVMRQAAPKVLVIYDVHVQELNQIPLIINYGAYHALNLSMVFNI